MAINLLTEVKGAGDYPSRRFNKRERKLIKEVGGPSTVMTDLYDFSVSGGAVSTITLNITLPANCIVTRLWTDELTNLTSGGSATVQIKAGSTELVAPQAYSAFAGAQLQTLTSGPIRLSSASSLNIAIATAALTAGKIRFFIEILQSE